MGLDLLPVVVVVVVLVALGAAWVARRRVRRRYERLVSGDVWSQTSLPVGLDAQHLVTWASFPRGDRGYGVRHAVTRAASVAMGGRVVTCELAVFTWWWEQRQADHRGSNDYHERALMAAAVRLPVAAPHVVVEGGDAAVASGRFIPADLLRQAVTSGLGTRVLELRDDVLVVVDRADRRPGVRRYDAAADGLVDLVSRVPAEVWRAVSERRREGRR